MPTPDKLCRTSAAAHKLPKGCRSPPQTAGSVKICLQRGRMFAPVDAIRVTRTGLSRHIADRRKFSAAILASVAVFLPAFVEFVLPAVDAVRMTRTGLSSQVPHTAEARPAMLAIIVRHFHFLSFYFGMVAVSTVERRGASYKAKVVPSLF